MNRRLHHPYPGLRPFERREAHIFFGREKQVDELLQRLKEQHFLAVMGASGSGKSSLVKAGMLAGLEKGYMGEIGSKWKIAEMRPGNQPFERLAASLEASDRSAWLAAQLRRGARSLHEYLNQSPLNEGVKLLILVDQFEEIFRYRQQRGNQAAFFVALILEASRHPDIYVTITMRSDFLGNAAAFYGLPEAINDGLYLTPRLTRDQLREAIALPAQLFGGKVEDALVNYLLNAAGTNPDQLPLLQHALMRLWEIDEDKILTLPEYRELRGRSGVLNRHLKQVYDGELGSDRQRYIAQILFRALTEREEDGKNVRRPVSAGEVLRQLEHLKPACTLDELQVVVRAFQDEGRNFLVMSTPELQTDTVLDISHESLIRQWKKLHDWVDEEVVKAKMYQRLLDAAQRYENGDGELWYGTDLALGKDWREKHQPHSAWAERYSLGEENQFDLAMGFLRESEDDEDRREQKKLERQLQKEREIQAELERQREETSKSQRRLVFALGALLLVAALAFWGLDEKRKANNEKNRADKAASDATAAKNLADREKEQRTRYLFDSRITQAGLLARLDNYKAANDSLERTRELDKEVASARRHARDLLAGFVDIQGGATENVFTGADGKPVVLPALSGNIAISPDGKWLATSGERGTIALFDLKARKLVQKLKGHDPDAGGNGIVHDIVFHPKEPWLFSAHNDGQIIQWVLPPGDSPARELKKLPKFKKDKVAALAFTPDGSVLASGHADGGIILWKVTSDTADGEINYFRELEGHTKTIAYNGLVFDSLERWLASASEDKTVRIWDWQNPEPYSNVSSKHSADTTAVAFSPDGMTLASAEDQSIILRNVPSLDKIRQFQGHQNTVYGLEFINDHLLASASRDTTIRLWDVSTSVTRKVFQGHTASVNGLAICNDDCNDGDQIALYSNSNDGTVRRSTVDFPGNWLLDVEGAPTAVAISPNGKLAVAGFENGALQIFSLEKQQNSLLYQTSADGKHKHRLTRLAFSEDGTRLAAADQGGSVTVWSAGKSGELASLHSFDDHKQLVNSVAFSPDGTQLATASNDGQIGLFDLNSGETISWIKAHDGEPVKSISFSADGQYLSSNSDTEIKLWDLRNRSSAPESTSSTNDNLIWTSISADGEQLVSVGQDQIVTVYSTRNLNGPEQRLRGHQQTVFKAVFSPDSRQLATISGDATVRFWDLDAASELFAIRLPVDPESADKLYDFDFRCTPTGCWVAVPLPSRKLAFYNLGTVDYGNTE